MKSALSHVSLLSMLSMLSVLSHAQAGDRQIVTKDITVGVGDTLRIAPGSELLFTAYTGIIVNGHLQAIGTEQNPIAFASTADTSAEGTAFDWNGIEITGTGSAELAYCLVTNATSGITADNADRLTIGECIFKTNGQWNLSIAGEIQPVTDGRPYSAKPAASAIPTPAELAAATPPQEPAPAIATKPPRDTRRTWRRVLISVGAAATATGIGELVNAHYIKQDYNAYAPGNAAFDAATPEARQRHFDDLRRKHDVARAVGWSLIGLGAADFVYLTFFF